MHFDEADTRYCTKTLTGHSEWVREVVPSDDGRLLVSVSNDQTARVWDFATGETKSELRGHEHVVECAVFAPANSYAAIRELTGINSNGGAAGTRPEAGRYAATGSRDKTVKLWDTASGQCLRTFVGHDNWVRALIFHPSGKYLLSASDDKTVKVWDLATGRCTKTLDAHGHFVTCAAWGRATVGGGGAEKDGKKDEPRRINVMATGCVDNTIKVGSRDSGRADRTRSGHHETSPPPSPTTCILHPPFTDTLFSILDRMAMGAVRATGASFVCIHTSFAITGVSWPPSSCRVLLSPHLTFLLRSSFLIMCVSCLRPAKYQQSETQNPRSVGGR